MDTSPRRAFQGTASRTVLINDPTHPYFHQIGNIVLQAERFPFTLDAEAATEAAFHLDKIHHNLDALSLDYVSTNTIFRLTSHWMFDPDTDIWHRQDTLTNLSTMPQTLYGLAMRLMFPSSRYSAYVQHSSWSWENQGTWYSLAGGTLTIDSNNGRTTQQASPYLFLKHDDTGHALAFHLVPNGNWFIRLQSLRPFGYSHPQIILEMGVGDRQFRPTLKAGASFELPPLLIQSIPGSKPEDGARPLHRHLYSRFLTPLPRTSPAVYNTWFDAFDDLNVPRLRKQLAAAKELGFEVFTIDAGWYGGAEDKNWASLVGYWEEKETAAFHGRMAEFADEVRAAGLGFGLWMEPERFGNGVPICREHPDWFIDGGRGFSQIDLTLPAARKWLSEEMSRLVKKYQLAWMKVDYNFDFGADPHHAAHTGYFAAWKKLLAELSARHPETIFEGCSSGAMRGDLGIGMAFPFHFLSDTTYPTDVLRIYQGAILRLPPGRIGLWSVLRGVGKVVPHYGIPVEQSPDSVVAPGGGTWAQSEVIDPLFSLRAACLGVFGMSGDLAGLPAETQGHIRKHLEFYKKWRAYLVEAEVTPLTPAREKSDRTGWIVFQMSHRQRPEYLLYAFRLHDANPVRQWTLRDLAPELMYKVISLDTPDAVLVEFSGSDLMVEGLHLELKDNFTAGIYIITPF